VKTCPTSFKDLLKPEYKGQVALNGNPTKSGSAFGGVYAAALANGGSFDDIQPGLDFFAKLKKNGNYTPVESTPATVEKGETPISIDWDYLNAGYADEFKSKGLDWKVVIPSDGQYAQYYSQAINKDAPHPAAARLWQEYLYSTEGQNLWLGGYARPALMTAMDKAGTLDKTAAAKLPKVTGTPSFPTEGQQSKAKTVIAQGWGKAVSG
jgi:putative spermidine/putrescine transport system substrate-binding protein